MILGKENLKMLPILLSTIDNYEDQLVFEEIYTKYKSASMRRALKMLNGKQFDAEDAFQKAWIQISQNLHKLKSHDEAAISTYIMKTIEFKVIDVVNENNEYRKYLEPAEVNPKEYISDDLMYLVCSNERHETIVNALKNMDDKYRDIMMLTYLQGFDAKSIAKQLNIKEKTVWTRLYRGKAILIEELKKRGITND